MPKVPKIVPQKEPALDAGVHARFELSVPASPEMGSLKMQKLKKRMMDPKAFVPCHAQKARLFKTWPLQRRKKKMVKKIKK